MKAICRHDKGGDFLHLSRERMHIVGGDEVPARIGHRDVPQYFSIFRPNLPLKAETIFRKSK